MSDVIDLPRDAAAAQAMSNTIAETLAKPDGHRTIYSALTRRTWQAMAERRLDDGLRSWHRILLDSSARMVADAAPAEFKRGAKLLDRAAAGERILALADLVRLSIDAARASQYEELMARAHVGEILSILASAAAGEFVSRKRLKEELGMGEANLSRVLTLMALNGLVERQPRGKTAAFRATTQGLSLARPPRLRAQRSGRGPQRAASGPRNALYRGGPFVVSKEASEMQASRSGRLFNPLLLQVPSNSGVHGGV